MSLGREAGEILALAFPCNLVKSRKRGLDRVTAQLRRGQDISENHRVIGAWQAILGTGWNDHIHDPSQALRLRIGERCFCRIHAASSVKKVGQALFHLLGHIKRQGLNGAGRVDPGGGHENAAVHNE